MHEFNLFEWFFGKAGLERYLNELTVSILSSLFVLAFLSVVSVIAWRSLRKSAESLVPSSRFSLHNIAEIVVEKLIRMMSSIMGDRAEKFLPLIGTLFIYILLSNLLGFIPGFMSPTTVITTNLACALVVFFYYNYVGIREQGVLHYLRHFLGPVIWLAPLFIVVEIISHLVRPLSLSVRLFGNMVGDHMALGVFSDLVPILIPILFMALGVFIALIQAFIFSILSAVYIALAIED